MNCPNCSHFNTKGTLFCEECKTFLPDSVTIQPETVSVQPAPAVKSVQSLVAPANDSPFGDFLPAWMNQPTGPKPASTRQSRPPASAPATPISIDSLLQETAGPGSGGGTGPLMVETARPASVAPNSQTANSFPWPETAPQLDPAQGLPVPAFQMPPLWFKPPGENPWQEVKLAEGSRAVPSNSIGNGYNPTLIGPDTSEPALPEPSGPEYGVDRGFYFFTDRDGNVIVQALAGFPRRLGGAVVDFLVAILIGVIVGFVVSLAFASMEFTRQNYTNFILSLSGLAIFLNFLYHAFLVGLTSQTIGHRLLKIKVIRRGGRSVGLVSGTVRALYGLVPTLLTIIISLILPADASGRNTVASILSVGIVSLTALGMAWSLLDNAHQGLHDKLADTYVVSTQES